METEYNKNRQEKKSDGENSSHQYNENTGTLKRADILFLKILSLSKLPENIQNFNSLMTFPHNQRLNYKSK